MPEPGSVARRWALTRHSDPNAARTYPTTALKLGPAAADVGRDAPSRVTRSIMSPSPAPSVVSTRPARPLRPAADCQPSADAGCGHCPECREAESRRFDAALRAGLDSIRRSEPSRG